MDRSCRRRELDDRHPRTLAVVPRGAVRAVHPLGRVFCVRARRAGAFPRAPRPERVRAVCPRLGAPPLRRSRVGRRRQAGGDAVRGPDHAPSRRLLPVGLARDRLHNRSADGGPRLRRRVRRGVSVGGPAGGALLLAGRLAHPRVLGGAEARPSRLGELPRLRPRAGARAVGGLRTDRRALVRRRVAALGPRVEEPRVGRDDPRAATRHPHQQPARYAARRRDCRGARGGGDGRHRPLSPARRLRHSRAPHHRREPALGVVSGQHLAPVGLHDRRALAAGGCAARHAHRGGGQGREPAGERRPGRRRPLPAGVRGADGRDRRMDGRARRVHLRLGARRGPVRGTWPVAARERCARAGGTRRHGAGDRCRRAVAAGWTGSRAGGRSAVVGPGWSGTGA